MDLLKIEEKSSLIELIYDADKSLMPGDDLGEAIVGMTTCLKIAGRAALIDFSGVYVYPIEEGSIKTTFAYIKDNHEKVIVDVGGNVVGGLILGAFGLIGTYGLATLKNPSGEVLAGVDKKVIEMCMNRDFRKSVSKIAQPLNEVNQKATIKFGSKGYEITCDNQYKFINDDQEKILPELKNGEQVSLIGRLTRMNMVPKNDLGFEYKGRVLSVAPMDDEKNVADEYHQYTPLPQVRIVGIVVRATEYEAPSLRVIRMEDVKDDQLEMFEDDSKATSSSQKN